MKVLIIGGLPESLLNFRGELIKTIIENNHQVIAMSADANKDIIRQIESMGCEFLSFPIQRNGLNPLSDLKVLIALYRIFRSEKPDVILSYTIKPVIWGGVASILYGKSRFFGLITGLGFAFQKGDVKRNLLCKTVIGLYRFALSKATGVIFQNPDNLNEFVEQQIIPVGKTYRVHGSGVKLDYFKRNLLPEKGIVFLTIARLLGEKGLREYAQAASLVKEIYPKSQFQIVGPEDPSPDGIPLVEVKKWHEEGYIEYLGETNDVRPYINSSHVFVLASYHEGMPRTVLEAMAIGRPILTTNVPGCRETVISGENGFLVEKANVEQLVDKMIWFIENQEELPAMADKSRELAKERYDVHKVNDSLLNIMELK
jgi:glycosyltransferase involved in cell wall biosynthesis